MKKERPIIFSAESIHAMDAGIKMQTLRVINPIPDLDKDYPGWKVNDAWQSGFVNVKCPYGKVGDMLWVKETFAHNWEYLRKTFRYIDSNESEILYRSNSEDAELWSTRGKKWKSPWYMDRRLSRYSLEITDVSVMRVQDITEEEARIEGATMQHEEHLGQTFNTYRAGFEIMWNSINAKRKNRIGNVLLPYSWGDNPLVWKIRYKMVTEVDRCPFCGRKVDERNDICLSRHCPYKNGRV